MIRLSPVNTPIYQCCWLCVRVEIDTDEPLSTGVQGVGESPRSDQLLDNVLHLLPVFGGLPQYVAAHVELVGHGAVAWDGQGTAADSHHDDNASAQLLI